MVYYIVGSPLSGFGKRLSMNGEPVPGLTIGWLGPAKSLFWIPTRSHEEANRPEPGRTANARTLHMSVAVDPADSETSARGRCCWPITNVNLQIALPSRRPKPGIWGGHPKPWFSTRGVEQDKFSDDAPDGAPVFLDKHSTSIASGALRQHEIFMSCGFGLPPSRTRSAR